MDDRELPLLFHARTADFQDLAVQASVTFRVTDPAIACARIDFSVDPDTGRWRGTPLEQVGGLLTETAQQQVLGLVAGSTLAGVLADGVARDPGPDPARAHRRLPAGRDRDRGHRRARYRAAPGAGGGEGAAHPGAGAIQQEADRSTYERRAVAVERERAIAENELQSQIELARREEQLSPSGAPTPGGRPRTRRPRAGSRPRRRRPGSERLAPRPGRTAPVRWARPRRQARRASVAAYRDLPQPTLLALAAKDLAGSLPQIGTLVLAPTCWPRCWPGWPPAAPSARRRRWGGHGDARAARRAGAPPHRADGAAGAARHPRSGRVLPAHQRAPDRGPGGPARSGAGGASPPSPPRSRRLAAGHGRAGRPAPVPVRARTTSSSSSARTASSPTSPSTSTARSSSASTPSRGATRACWCRTRRKRRRAAALLSAAAAAARAQTRASSGWPWSRRSPTTASELTALNEIYLGQPTHQTARYTLRLPGGQAEAQASSGLIVVDRDRRDGLVPLGVAGAARAPSPCRPRRGDGWPGSSARPGPRRPPAPPSPRAASPAARSWR